MIPISTKRHKKQIKIDRLELRVSTKDKKSIRRMAKRLSITMSEYLLRLHYDQLQELAAA